MVSQAQGQCIQLRTPGVAWGTDFLFIFPTVAARQAFFALVCAFQPEKKELRHVCVCF